MIDAQPVLLMLVLVSVAPLFLSPESGFVEAVGGIISGWRVCVGIGWFYLKIFYDERKEKTYAISRDSTKGENAGVV